MGFPEDACVKRALELARASSPNSIRERLAECVKENPKCHECFADFPFDSGFFTFCEVYAYMTTVDFLESEHLSVLFEVAINIESTTVRGYLDVLKSKLVVRYVRLCEPTLQHATCKTVCDLCESLASSELDVVHHNVADSLIIISRYFWGQTVLPLVRGIVNCRTRSALLILRKLVSSNRQLFEDIDSDFAHEIIALSFSAVIKSNSKSAVCLLKDLYRLTRFRVVISQYLLSERTVNEHGDPLNNACRLLVMAFSAEVGEFYASNPSHKQSYSLDQRIRAVSLHYDTHDSDDCIDAILSMLMDCTPRHYEQICAVLRKLVASLGTNDRSFALLLLDNRAPLRMGIALLKILREDDLDNMEGTLLEIACCNSFEACRTAALDLLLLRFSKLSSEVQDKILMEGRQNGFNIGVLTTVSVKAQCDIGPALCLVSELSELLDHKDQSVKDVVLVVELIDAICIVIKHVDLHNFDGAIEWMVRAKEVCGTASSYAFERCNVEAPESYSIDNDADDLEVRHDWKIIQHSARLFHLCGEYLGNEVVHQSLMALSYMICRLKHRGAFSSLFDPIVGLASILFSAGTVNNMQFDEYVDHTWSCLLSDSSIDGMTRRSAGIPFLFKAILHSVVEDDLPSTSSHIAERLLVICRGEYSEIVKIRASNVICELIRDRKFDELMAPFMHQFLDISFELLSSDIWGLRNVSLRLFGAVHTRCLQIHGDSEGLVDIRRLTKIFSTKLISCVQCWMRQAREEHIYPLLVFISRIRPPLGVFEDSILSFANECSAFLSRLSQPGHNFYIHQKVAEVSARFGVEVKLPDFIPGVVPANTFDFRYQDRVCVNFIHHSLSGRYCFESLQTTGDLILSQDERMKLSSNEAILERLLTKEADCTVFLEMVGRCLDEGKTVSTRRIAAKIFFESVGRLLEENRLKLIPIIYKLIVDDDEDVRCAGCKSCSLLFGSEAISCPFWCMDKIWEFVSTMSLDIKKSLLGELFFEDFVADLRREMGNVDDKPIFRREPLNVYRDYLVESFLIRRHLSPDTYRILDDVSNGLDDVHYKGAHYMRRSIKCLHLLSSSQGP